MVTRVGTRAGTKVATATAATAALLLWCTAPAAADTTVHADLVEQNGSGAAGRVVLTATDAGALEVHVRATGLLPGPHAQHLHGSLQGGEFECAGMDADADGDGWLTTEEASGEYGSAFLALTTRGDTSARSGLDLERMPLADEQGRLTYHRTIPAAEVPDRLLAQLSHMHVVQHGIDANGNGEYDLDALGESSFAANLGVSGVPEEATNPTSCGMVTGASAAHAPRGGVETGGGTGSPDASWPLAALGLGLVAAAAGLAARRRSGGEPAGR